MVDSSGSGIVVWTSKHVLCDREGGIEAARAIVAGAMVVRACLREGSDDRSGGRSVTLNIIEEMLLVEQWIKHRDR